MDKKLFSPLMSAANNIVKVQRPLTKRAQDYNAFINFLSTSNKDIKRIKLPEKKKVKFLADNGITFTGAGGRKGIIPDLIKGIGGGLLGGLGLKGLSKAKIPQLLKPKTKVKTKTPLTAKSLRTLKPKGRIPKIRGIAGPLNLVLAGLEYGGRLGEGQTQEQAILGTAGSVVGGIGGAKAGAAAGAAIGALFGGVGAVPGAIIGGLIGGIGGSIAGGSLLDKMTGVEEKPKDKIEKRLKRQERIQKERAEKSGITLNDIVIKFERVISKFEKVTLGMTGVDTSDKGKQKKGKDEGMIFDEPVYPPVTPSTEAYDGPVTGDTFFPLPGGAAEAQRGQEYGDPRGGRTHEGIDLVHRVGDLAAPVSAYKTGKVVESVANGYDGYVTIDHGGGLKTRYFHTTPLVQVGDVVYGGQQVATLYPDGKNTHLHFEVYRNGSPVNPRSAGLGQSISTPLSKERAKEQHDKNIGQTAKAGVNTMERQQSPEEFFKGTKYEKVLKENRESFYGKKERKNVRGSKSVEAEPTPEVKEMQKMYNSYVRNLRTKRESVQPSPQTAPQVQPPIAPTGVTPSMIILSPQQQSAIQPQSIPVPIPMGGGGSGGVTVISPDEGEILNSLWKTMLLTNLSAA